MDEANDQGVDKQQDTNTEADTTDWKAKAIEFEAKYKAESGSRRRLEKDLKQIASKDTETQTERSTQQDSKGFDYAQKAYLKSSGIQADEFDFVKEVMDATGKNDLDAILGSKYFQAELKERRETKATADATPIGTKRAGNQTRNDVDYWIQKGELPKDNPALARKVVNAKIQAEQNTNRFSPNSVIVG